ncbi:MAG: metallophosphoesterase [Intestinibaculum porci]|uniref:metallophosphoesterase n=1 Tax=Intestinibaculum porci TaxID=2487118 RepID=UPI003F005DBF
MKKALIPLALGALMTMYVRDNKSLTIKRLDITDERIPVSFDGFRILQMTDVHQAKFGYKQHRLLKKAKSCAPDLIAITGDVIVNSHTPLGEVIDYVKSLQAIAPVYFICGNHETLLNKTDLMQFILGLKICGVTVLRNETVRLYQGKDEILLSGIDDPSFKAHKTIEQAQIIDEEVKGLGESQMYRILLSHRPECFDVYVKHHISLVLCGHTHGGQIRFPFIGALVAPHQKLFPTYDRGLFEKGATKMYISAGLGASDIPLRVLNPPEMTLVTLHHQ